MKSDTKALALLATAATVFFFFPTPGACFEKNPPRLAGKPTKMSPEEFPWADPFTPPSSSSSHSQQHNYTPTCKAQKTFQASEFLLDDLLLPPPKGLEPYSDVLKKALRDKPYPGGWDGVDPHGYDRSLVLMGYADVPVLVRAWIEEQQQQEQEADGSGSLFSVFERKGKGEKAAETAKPPEHPRALQGGEVREDPGDKDKVVLFAPGAMYRALPLWVAEGSDCADALSDLSKYSPSPSDGAVVAWTTEHSRAKRSKGRDMQFTITAQVLKKAGGESESEGKAKAKESPSESTKEEL